MENKFTDRWNEVCFLLSESIKQNISEESFEKNVIQALRVLEWKSYQGDIEVRPSYPIGAAKSLIPDLIVKDDDKRKLFVIEIKQPAVHLSERIQHQLFSYMRQLKLEYGILIGQVIQIFYDGNLIIHDEPVLLETIAFEKNNPRGIQFAGLFSKDGFSSESLSEYTSQAIKQIRRAENYKSLLRQITSDQYARTVSSLIKQSLAGDYDEELLNSVLSGVDIKIRIKENDNSHVIVPKADRGSKKLPLNPEKLQIELVPDDEEIFKRKLLQNRITYITTYYKNGSRQTRQWKAMWLKEGSSIMGNLRSKSEFRNGEWQKRDIVRVVVSLNKDPLITG
ncbi:hypothetical protein DSECCO2_324590 [anaerobic digester metagenome]